MRRERANGRTQEQAADRSGMSIRTARTYERLGQLPSQLKQPRRYRTRPDPFEGDWPWVVKQLERDGALQATTLFALLRTLSPGRYQAGQVRTFQEHIAVWRTQHGPAREVMFPQIHRPGVDAQSDFTRCLSPTCLPSAPHGAAESARRRPRRRSSRRRRRVSCVRARRRCGAAACGSGHW